MRRDKPLHYGDNRIIGIGSAEYDFVLGVIELKRRSQRLLDIVFYTANRPNNAYPYVVTREPYIAPVKAENGRYGACKLQDDRDATEGAAKKKEVFHQDAQISVIKTLYFDSMTLKRR